MKFTFGILIFRAKLFFQIKSRTNYFYIVYLYKLIIFTLFQNKILFSLSRGDFMDLRKVSDQILLANMKNLASQERVLYTEVLHHLREIQRRRLFADLGQPSLFAYCVNILKYSNGEADRRIKAVAMIREMPAIEEKIVSGELSLTNVAKAKEFFNQEGKVAPMKPEAKLELIKKLENKSTREAEKILLAESSSPAPEVKGKAQVKTLAKRRYISVKVTRNVGRKQKESAPIAVESTRYRLIMRSPSAVVAHPN